MRCAGGGGGVVNGNKGGKEARALSDAWIERAARPKSHTGDARVPRASPARANTAEVGRSRSFASPQTVGTRPKDGRLLAQERSVAHAPSNGRRCARRNVNSPRQGRAWTRTKDRSIGEWKSHRDAHARVPRCGGRERRVWGQTEAAHRRQRCDSEWSPLTVRYRAPAAQGRGGEWRLGSQPSSPLRSGSNCHTCRFSNCMDAHFLFPLTAYSSASAPEGRQSGS